MKVRTWPRCVSVYIILIMRLYKIFEKYSQTIPRSILITAMEVLTTTMSSDG